MTGTAGKPMSAAQARAAWVEHRFFKYRGCAPHPDNPRVLAARPDLPVDTHHAADRDGAEPQADRVRREHEAVELCLNCPVMVACDAFANSVTPEGKLAQPDGVWGGRLAKDRRAAFARVQHEVAPVAPVEQLRTPQKLAVLRALAMCWDPFEVAAAAGVPLRTANWQRSIMVSDMGLPKTASRERMLAVAVEWGLVDPTLVVADDGSVPAVPPPGAAPGPAPVQLSLWQATPASEPVGADVHPILSHEPLEAAA